MRAVTMFCRAATGGATGGGSIGAGMATGGGRRRLVAGRRGGTHGAEGRSTAGWGSGSGAASKVGTIASSLVGFLCSLATTHSRAPTMRTTSRMETNSGTTVGGSVPPEPAAPVERTGLRTLAFTGLVALTSVFIYLALSYQIPYYAFAPGSAVDTSQLVTVDDDHVHTPDGSILLTTISLGKVTLFEALKGWLDPAVDVVTERYVVGDRDIDEAQLREENLRAMAESKQKAIGVAFEALGVDAITGAGAEVVEIVPDSPAAAVLEVGDTIIAIDGNEIALDAEAVEDIGGRSPGDEATLRVRDADGAERDVTVTFVPRPGEERRAYLGVALTTKDLRFDFPFDVDVQSERIGGPSAGLAFTLEVIDQLTPGELTGGRQVATTGTIELDGSVGEVGGVAQKTMAVRESGADLFIVPSGELEVARRFAGDDLDVVAADTLDEALAALAEVGGNGLALPNLGADGAS
jgi:PDZ domain-containing protein